MRKLYLVSAILLLFSSAMFAQVGVNTDNSEPDGSAMLDVKSTTKGALLPRMTRTQIESITTPANGLQVFCTTDGKMYIYVAANFRWKEVAYGSGTIIPPFSCGMPISINHVAGAVAPVTKTTTYGTVTNIPGELTKCWITSNLGSDHQATAVNDATEASAGWYWQFNLKQGYKHDGTTRTPNTTWIDNINESTDWIAANDPCSIELGIPWRIPNLTEWNNVDNSGIWTNWNGPWNSGLKLHAAGYLDGSNGSLYNRSSNGYYWSNTQNGATIGWYLDFYTGASNMSNYYKANAFSVRCVRDN